MYKTSCVKLKDSGSMSKTVDCLIVHHVVVSSAVRDVSAYPCPNHYSVRLPDSIKSCVRVRLLSANIPRTEPPIKETSWLDFDEGGQIYSICVKPGFYTIDELITSVGSLFSTSSSPWSYCVTFILCHIQPGSLQSEHNCHQHRSSAVLYPLRKRPSCLELARKESWIPA